MDRINGMNRRIRSLNELPTEIFVFIQFIL